MKIVVLNGTPVKGVTCPMKEESLKHLRGLDNAHYIKRGWIWGKR